MGIRVPREIYHLVEYLSKNAMTTPNLFDKDRKYSQNPVINEIRDWLDNWSTDEFRMYLNFKLLKQILLTYFKLSFSWHSTYNS